jgi:Ca2+-binding EF-hand superfamily protein
VRLKNLDSDKSGALSWKEFQKSPTLKNLSKEERRQAFRRLDADKNDELSSKELKSPFERGSGKKPQRPAPKK